MIMMTMTMISPPWENCNDDDDDDSQCPQKMVAIHNDDDDDSAPFTKRLQLAGFAHFKAAQVKFQRRVKTFSNQNFKFFLRIKSNPIVRSSVYVLS